jgi:hypothetical protein
LTLEEIRLAVEVKVTAVEVKVKVKMRPKWIIMAPVELLLPDLVELCDESGFVVIKFFVLVSSYKVKLF